MISFFLQRQVMSWLPVAFVGLLFTAFTPDSNAQDEASSQPLVSVVPTFEYLEIGRPIIVTHAGDGTDRLFIASQYGTIYVMPNDPIVEEPDVFMDMTEHVTYKDNQNEEGFLGFAFHPEFATNRQFFVFYTTTNEAHLSVISRFTANEDGTEASFESEEVIMEIPQRFWNHNGGTIAFGPDGYLYVGLGDGGSARDPDGNGQNLSTLNGSILRIDVDSTTGDLTYGIPEDNPFVDTEDARPEIYAYGLRNVWRLAFDRETGDLWAADVGQDLWEEINIIEKGGNYGWNRREGKHPFGDNGAEASDEFVEPVWEYHHDVGKSITGGFVYRGEQVPSLQGAYVFADYVSGKIWALRYDKETKEVTEHFEFSGVSEIPVITFGEDEAGEIYFTDSVGRIFTFEQ